MAVLVVCVMHARTMRVPVTPYMKCACVPSDIRMLQLRRRHTLHPNQYRPLFLSCGQLRTRFRKTRSFFLAQFSFHTTRTQLASRRVRVRPPIQSNPRSRKQLPSFPVEEYSSHAKYAHTVNTTVPPLSLTQSASTQILHSSQYSHICFNPFPSSPTSTFSNTTRTQQAARARPPSRANPALASRSPPPQ